MLDTLGRLMVALAIIATTARAEHGSGKDHDPLGIVRRTELAARVPGGLVALLDGMRLQDRWILVDRLRVTGQDDMLARVANLMRDPRLGLGAGEVAALDRYLRLMSVEKHSSKHDWKSWENLRRVRSKKQATVVLAAVALPTTDHACVYSLVWWEEYARVLREQEDSRVSAGAYVRAARIARELGLRVHSRSLIRRMFARHFSESVPYWMVLDSVRRRQKKLHVRECSVAYSTFGSEVLAFVVGKERWDVVPLGVLQPILRSASAFHLPGGDTESARDALRKSLALPLGLPKSVTHVVVYPQKQLPGVPWSLIFDPVEVRCLPMRLCRREAEPAFAKPATGQLEFATRVPPFAKGVSSRAKRARGFAALVAYGNARPRWRSVVWNASFDAKRRMFVSPNENERPLSVRGLVHFPIRADVLVLSGVGASNLNPSIQISEPGWKPAANEFDAGFVARTGRFLERIEGLKIGPIHLVGEISPLLISASWEPGRSATAAFLSKLGSELGRGAKVPDALAAARRSVARTAQWNAPHYWGCWELWGLREN